MVHWLRLHASDVGCPGLIPGEREDPTCCVVQCGGRGGIFFYKIFSSKLTYRTSIKCKIMENLRRIFVVINNVYFNIFFSSDKFKYLDTRQVHRL